MWFCKNHVDNLYGFAGWIHVGSTQHPSAWITFFFNQTKERLAISGQLLLPFAHTGPAEGGCTGMAWHCHNTTETHSAKVTLNLRKKSSIIFSSLSSLTSCERFLLPNSVFLWFINQDESGNSWSWKLKSGILSDLPWWVVCSGIKTDSGPHVIRIGSHNSYKTKKKTSSISTMQKDLHKSNKMSRKLPIRIKRGRQKQSASSLIYATPRRQWTVSSLEYLFLKDLPRNLSVSLMQWL